VVRDAWKLILEEAKDLQGRSSQWRRRRKRRNFQISEVLILVTENGDIRPSASLHVDNENWRYLASRYLTRGGGRRRKISCVSPLFVPWILQVGGR